MTSGEVEACFFPFFFFQSELVPEFHFIGVEEGLVGNMLGDIQGVSSVPAAFSLYFLDDGSRLFKGFRIIVEMDCFGIPEEGLFVENTG